MAVILLIFALIIIHDCFPQYFPMALGCLGCCFSVLAVCSFFCYLFKYLCLAEILFLFIPIITATIVMVVWDLYFQKPTTENDDIKNDPDTYSLCDPDESPDHRFPSDAEVSDIPIEDTYPLRMPSETSSQTPSNPQP